MIKPNNWYCLLFYAHLRKSLHGIKSKQGDEELKHMFTSATSAQQRNKYSIKSAKNWFSLNFLFSLLSMSSQMKDIGN